MEFVEQEIDMSEEAFIYEAIRHPARQTKERIVARSQAITWPSA